jgi:anti-anti-sigma regulatory factor
MSELQLRTCADEPSRIVLEVHGVVHHPSLAALRSSFIALLHAPAEHIILDLHEVTRIDPAGVGTVIAGCEALSDLGKQVQVLAFPRVITDLRAGGIPEHSLSAQAA